MSEPINWREMAIVERDRVVAEKVMGVTDFLCTGKLSYDGNNTLYEHHFYICQECKVRLTVTDSYRTGCGIPKTHAKYIPHYTTSMDAAWLIVEELAHPESQDRQWQVANVHFTHAWDDTPLYGVLHKKSAEEAATRICIWALEALGYEVLV